MKDIHNHQLFTDITPEEEVSVQGGNFWSALAGGSTGLLSWLNQSGNGIIIGDNKNSLADSVRAGDPGQDVPGNWLWGVRDNGRYILGGRFITYNSVASAFTTLLRAFLRV